MSQFTTLHKIASDLLDQYDDKASIADKLNTLFSPLQNHIHFVHYANGMIYSINIDRHGWLMALFTGSKVKITVKEFKQVGV